MANTDINATVKQLRERTEYFNTYYIVTSEFIGVDSTISALAKTNKKGTKYNPKGSLSGVVQSSVTEKIEADRMKWTLQYKGEILSGGGGSGDDPYTSRTWSMNMYQMEYPIERFLLSSDQVLLQKWRNTDDEHKSKYQYFEAMSGTGPQYGDLTGRALSAAVKVMKGLESVLRFYPQATRTSIYETKRGFPLRVKKLNHIDDEPDSKFGELSASWLKTGFDWTENNDTTWTLTESWQGGELWDPDFYGPNAWKFDGQ